MRHLCLIAGIAVSLAGVSTAWVVEPPAQAASDAPKEGAAKNHRELVKFDGTWELVLSITDGKPADLGKVKNRVVVYEAGRMAAELGQVQGHHNQFVAQGVGTIQVDASEAPAHIDSTYGTSPAKTATFQGIYKFEGKTLTLCFSGFGKARPKQFESKEGSGNILLVYKRAQRGIRPKDISNFPTNLDVPPAQ